MKLRLQKAFTLVELLIVIGIIGILAVTFLVTLNPAEAQRKARDSQRISDMNKLQVFVEQLINDDPTASINLVTSAGGATACNSNWSGQAACQYLRIFPTDPVNNQSRRCVGVAANAPACLMIYRIMISNGEYEIDTRLESPSNAAKALNDGGTGAANAQWYEVGNNVNLFN